MRMVILIALLILSPTTFALTTDDLKQAKPELLLQGMHSSCKSNNSSAFLSLYSSRMVSLVSSRSLNDRKQFFDTSCSVIVGLVVNKLNGNPASATFYINENGKSLCITPSGEPKSCKLQFNVVVENSQLKKDEL